MGILWIVGTWIAMSLAVALALGLILGRISRMGERKPDAARARRPARLGAVGARYRRAA